LAMKEDPKLEQVSKALDHCKKAANRKEEPVTENFKIKWNKRGIQFNEKFTVVGEWNGTTEFTYEKYNSTSSKSALKFLQLQSVPYRFYYIEIDTPDGLVGKDINGIYNE